MLAYKKNKQEAKKKKAKNHKMIERREEKGKGRK